MKFQQLQKTKFKFLALIIFSLFSVFYIFHVEKANAIYLSGNSWKPCYLNSSCQCNTNAVITAVGSEGETGSGINKIQCSYIYANDGTQLTWTAPYNSGSYGYNATALCAPHSYMIAVNFGNDHVNTIDCAGLWYSKNSQSLLSGKLNDYIHYNGTLAYCQGNPANGLGDIYAPDWAVDQLVCPWVQEPASPTPKYRCSGSSCIRDDTNGTFTDSNCNGTCAPSCSCSAWSSGSCGAGSCASNQRYQARTCSPYACSTFEQCVPDSTCAQPANANIDVNPKSTIVGGYITVSGSVSNASYYDVCGAGFIGQSGWYCQRVFGSSNFTLGASESSAGRYWFYIYVNGSSTASDSDYTDVSSSQPSAPGPFSWYTPSIGCSGSQNYITVSWTPSANAIYYSLWKDGYWLAKVYGTSYTDKPGSTAPIGYDVYAFMYENFQPPYTRVSQGNLYIRNYYNWPNCYTPPPSPSGSFWITSNRCVGGQQVIDFTTTAPATVYQHFTRRAKNNFSDGISLTSGQSSYSYSGDPSPYYFENMTESQTAAPHTWHTPISGNGGTAVYYALFSIFNASGLDIASMNCSQPVQPPTANLWADNTTVNPGGSTTIHWTTTNCSAANSCSVTLNGSAVGYNGTQSTGPLSSTTTYTLVATNTAGTAQQSITINVAATSGFNAIFIANSISITRSSQLNISQDSNAVNNPPPGFADLSAPVFREKAP